jgi:hypothetical protein
MIHLADESALLCSATGQTAWRNHESCSPLVFFDRQAGAASQRRRRNRPSLLWALDFLMGVQAFFAWVVELGQSSQQDIVSKS